MLRPEHAEGIRKYLLGQDVFPSFARVVVFVSDDQVPINFCGFPRSDPKDRHDEYTFMIPGIEFRFLTGDSFDMYAPIFTEIPGDLVFVLHEHLKTSRPQDLFDMLKTSPLKGKLKPEPSGD